MIVACQMTVILLLFWAIGVIEGPHESKMKIGHVVVMNLLEIKKSVFACLLREEGCDSFPKHLNLALTPI